MDRCARFSPLHLSPPLAALATFPFGNASVVRRKTKGAPPLSALALVYLEVWPVEGKATRQLLQTKKAIK